jgi:DNA topoisomerase-1
MTPPTARVRVSLAGIVSRRSCPTVASRVAVAVQSEHARARHLRRATDLRLRAGKASAGVACHLHPDAPESHPAMSPHAPPGKPSLDAQDAARAAGLRYVSDEQPGICRRRCGRGFTYVDAEGRTVRDGSVRERISALAIPPAWSEVWICSAEHGHLQATGRDDEGRKQYLYHARWRAYRDQEKYRRLADIGPRLPALRRAVGRALEGSGLERNRVVAGAVRLLDQAGLRVGSEVYAEENESFGLTTLRKDHVSLRRERLRLQYPGKAGQERDVVVRDGALARLVRALLRTDEENLFAFENGATGGRYTRLRPEHVNEYLRGVLGTDATAKDFRTWLGSVEALRVLASADPGVESEPERVAIDAVDAAAEVLGNLRATAREFYVHPGLLHAFESGELASLLEQVELPASRPGFRKGERLLLGLLPKLKIPLEVD